MFCFFTVPVHAASVQHFVVWHPGETGSTAQAQPVMDALSAYFHRKIPGTTWQAKYFPSEREGKHFITQRHPTFGIVSQLMMQRYRNLGMRTLLATHPLPHGKAREHWYLVRGTCLQSSKTIYAAEPFLAADVRQLFGEERTSVQPTDNLLLKLKTIADGSCDRVLVSERVWKTVQYAGAWTKSLTSTASDDTVPTPSVVAFPGSDATIAAQLTTALRAMSADLDGQALLAELRLAGF